MQFKGIQQYKNIFGEPRLPKDPKWVVAWDIQEGLMRVSFTQFWNTLNTHVKSALISGGGLIVAVAGLQAAKYVFPAADFTPVEYAVTVAISAFLVNMVKEKTLTD